MNLICVSIFLIQVYIYIYTLHIYIYILIVSEISEYSAIEHSVTMALQFILFYYYFEGLKATLAYFREYLWGNVGGSAADCVDRFLDFHRQSKVCQLQLHRSILLLVHLVGMATGMVMARQRAW